MAHTWTLRHPEKGRRCRHCGGVVIRRVEGRRETHPWCRLMALVRRGLREIV